MSWQHHFEKAKRSTGPISVDKQLLGPIPPRFEGRGPTINGLFGIYEGERGLDKIRITEFPGQYRISVSNPVASSALTSLPISQSSPDGDMLKSLATVGLGVLGAAAIGKVLEGSQNSTIPDPKRAHRVFISHSWSYKDHYNKLKRHLDNAGFEYFDHSVCSDDPIDAQLPNHLRKKIRDQMQSATVVVVMAGMYVAHSDWIQEEIEIANEMGKPIIGVIPKENDRVPAMVQKHATELVEADERAVLNAIDNHGS